VLVPLEGQFGALYDEGFMAVEVEVEPEVEPSLELLTTERQRGPRVQANEIRHVGEHL
jgi:hypothetical protein